jgi:hypothetical protein
VPTVLVGVWAVPASEEPDEPELPEPQPTITVAQTAAGTSLRMSRVPRRTISLISGG